MGVGELKHTVVFFSNQQQAEASGGFTDDYSSVVTLMGSLKKMSSHLVSAAGEIVTNNMYQITVRYSPALVLKPGLIAKIGDREFTITGWEKKEEKNFYVTFNAEERGG